MPSQQRKRKQRLANTVRTALVSVLVVAFFAIPALMTGRWVKAVVLGPDDPRKVTALSPLQIRPFDKQHPTLMPFEQPIVSITFDDGWESVYTQASPILQEKGFPTTQYLIGGVFDNPLYMSVGQVRAMQKAGHEIASHSMTHPDLTLLTDTKLNWELTETRKVLQKQFNVTPKDFASPLGAVTEHSLRAIAREYRSQRDTEGDPSNTVNELDVNVKDKWDIYNIKAYSVRQSTTLGDIQRLVDYAVAHNGWLVLTYHQVAPDVAQNSEEFGVTPQALRQQLDLISSRPIRVSPLGQVLDAYEQQHSRSQAH
jgi:peptidoglycan/xylan/chitin deacetylase (PgdA/CDA1 family)